MIKYFQNKMLVCQVSLANNIPIILENYKNFSKLYGEVIFFIICPKKQIKIFKKKLNFKNIIIINENKLISFLRLNKIFNHFFKNIKYKNQLRPRLKWYYQQFLKISFILNQRVNKKSKILLWDADTLILKKIKFLDYKNSSINYANVFEYHKPYFLTAKKMLKIEVFKHHKSAVNQFIYLQYKDIKSLKKIFSAKNKRINSYFMIKKIFSSMIDANKKFNHSMFSEYEFLNLMKLSNKKKYHQKIIFFLRYRLKGQLSNFQKKICILFNCLHVTYEQKNSLLKNKSILNKREESLNFFKILIRNYLKYITKKIRYNLTILFV